MVDIDERIITEECYEEIPWMYELLGAVYLCSPRDGSTDVYDWVWPRDITEEFLFSNLIVDKRLWVRLINTRLRVPLRYQLNSWNDYVTSGEIASDVCVEVKLRYYPHAYRTVDVIEYQTYEESYEFLRILYIKNRKGILR
jgi:hypothetical protein